MGVIVYKVNLGTTITGPEGKQRLLIAIARICSIFYTSSKKTINLGADEPMEIIYKIPNRAEVALKTKEFTQAMVKDLTLAEKYNMTVFVGPVQVRFNYDRPFHMDNALEVELRCEYKENMSKLILGAVLTKNVIASQLFFGRMSDRIERTYDLLLTLFKKFLGDTFYFTLTKNIVEKYNRDVIYFNILGFEFTIKRRFQ
jgi:hypothetical protein